ncbi:hypothetical protein AB6C72_25710, partial [Vibrio splendidus]
RRCLPLLSSNLKYLSLCSITQLNVDNAQFQLPCRLIRIGDVIYVKCLKWNIAKEIYLVVSYN